MNKQAKTAARRKAERKKEKISYTMPGGKLVKIILMLCFIALIALFYFEIDIRITMTLLLLSLIFGAVYGFLFKQKILTTPDGENVGRFILSYGTTVIVVFFYAFAMVRANQMNDVVRVIIALAAFFVFYCINTATKGLLHSIKAESITESKETANKEPNNQEEKNVTTNNSKLTIQVSEVKEIYPNTENTKK